MWNRYTENYKKKQLHTVGEILVTRLDLNCLLKGTFDWNQRHKYCANSQSPTDSSHDTAVSQEVFTQWRISPTIFMNR